MKSLFDGPCAVRYVSHRGYTPLAPENSLPSFACAGLLGQWAIETDVRVTRDGRLVCCHDADLLRMFGHAGCVEQMAWKELAPLRISSGNRLACFEEAQLRMPLLEEYLAICRRYGCVPFIELKTPQTELVLRTVRNAGFEDGGVVMSAIPVDWLYQVRKRSKTMFIHWIFADEKQLEAFARAGHAGVSLNLPDAFACPRETIDAVHALGLKICLRAGDHAASVRQMLHLGLDYIPTNQMHREVCT